MRFPPSRALRSGGEAWDPIPELQPPAGSTTTILFILPQKIYYTAPSDDPIFPAAQLRYLPNWETPYWLYNGGHATVLACVDRTSWRDPYQGGDWRSLTVSPAPIKDPHTRGGFWLLMNSLFNTNIYSTLSRRLASALDAQQRITGFSSLPLAQQQWKVEATQLFETSLTRIQLDAKNIARGVLADYPGYRKMPTKANICENTYLFMSDGWVNVNRSVSLAILIPCLVIVVFAIPINSEQLVMPDLIFGFHAEGFAVGTVGIFDTLGKNIKWVFEKTVNGIKWLWWAVKRCFLTLLGVIRALF